MHGESGSGTRTRTRYSDNSGYRHDQPVVGASVPPRAARRPRTGRGSFPTRSPAVFVGALCAGAAPVAFLLAFLVWQQPGDLPMVVVLVSMGLLLVETGVLVILVRWVSEQSRRLRRHQVLIEQLSISSADL